MYCSQCGTQVPDDSAFCSECGARLAERGASSENLGSRPAEVSRTASRLCEWCAESILQDALRCPRCQKWRKDIDSERVLYYLWTGAALIPVLMFIVGLRNGWWHRGTGGLFDWSFEFSVNAFLGSASGIAIMIGFLITGLLSFYYYYKVSTKIGSWWWL